MNGKVIGRNSLASSVVVAPHIAVCVEALLARLIFIEKRITLVIPVSPMSQTVPDIHRLVKAELCTLFYRNVVNVKHK